MFKNKTPLLPVVAILIIDLYSINAYSPQFFNENVGSNLKQHDYISSKSEFETIIEQEPTDKNVPDDPLERNQYGYAGIQYAPLILKSEEQTLNEERRVGQNIPGFFVSNNMVNKSDIEPRREDDKPFLEVTKEPIIYGHNIQIQEPQRIYTAYDMIYKDDNEFTTKKIFSPVTLVNPYVYYHKTDKSTETPPEDETKGKKEFTNASPTDEKNFQLSRHYNKKPDIYDNERTLYEKESRYIQPQFIHARPYRLHLNVARAYNIVKASYKNRFPNKMLPLCQSRHKSKSTHLITPPAIQTKLYPLLYNYSRSKVNVNK